SAWAKAIVAAAAALPRLAGLPAGHLVAGVAVAASPVGVALLAEVLEDVARAALRGLAEADHRAELLLVAGPALLVVGEVGAQVHLGELPAQPLPAPAAMLAHQP